MTASSAQLCIQLLQANHINEKWRNRVHTTFRCIRSIIIRTLFDMQKRLTVETDRARLVGKF